jgi:hypothetical protein
MRGVVLVIAVGLTGCAAEPQQGYVDPQAVMSSLLARQVDQLAREDAERRQQEAMRLQYQRASNAELMTEFARYCPNGTPPCVQSPPELLIHEASRRGLIEPAPNQRQQPVSAGINCITMPLGMGASVTDCY